VIHFFLVAIFQAPPQRLEDAHGQSGAQLGGGMCGLPGGKDVPSYCIRLLCVM
jgi:hypothetical protein